MTFSRPLPKLDHWLTPRYLSSPTKALLSKNFSQQRPFPYLELKDFFLPERATALLQALQEEIKNEQFLLQEADLFKFKQTADFASSSNNQLKEFREFLCSLEFSSYLAALTDTSIQPNIIDISATLYEETNFLLCHDDRLEGRKIAFFYYLSTLKRNDGGTLNLFSIKNGKPTDVAASIIPTSNTFAFFLVSEKSFHEVEEVVRDVQRLTISGWFHGQ